LLESILDTSSRKKVPSILYPNPRKSHSAKCFARLKRGTHLPGLENIKRWAEHPWEYRDASGSISPERLKAVLLWCRSLQFALQAVEQRFGLDSVRLLVE